MKRFFVSMLSVAFALTSATTLAAPSATPATQSPPVSVADLPASTEVPNYVLASSGATSRQYGVPRFTSEPKGVLIMRGQTLNLQFTFVIEGYESFRVWFDGVVIVPNQYVSTWVGPSTTRPQYIIIEVVNYGYYTAPTRVRVELISRYGTASQEVTVTMGDR